MRQRAADSGEAEQSFRRKAERVPGGGHADHAKATLRIPNGAEGKTIHVILEATDGGAPALTTYRRFVLNVRRRGRVAKE
jgi:hypothetical protein